MICFLVSLLLVWSCTYALYAMELHRPQFFIWSSENPKPDNRFEMPALKLWPEYLSCGEDMVGNIESSSLMSLFRSDFVNWEPSGCKNTG